MLLRVLILSRFLMPERRVWLLVNSWHSIGGHIFHKTYRFHCRRELWSPLNMTKSFVEKIGEQVRLWRRLSPWVRLWSIIRFSRKVQKFNKTNIQDELLSSLRLMLTENIVWWIEVVWLMVSPSLQKSISTLLLVFEATSLAQKHPWKGIFSLSDLTLWKDGIASFRWSLQQCHRSCYKILVHLRKV